MSLIPICDRCHGKIPVKESLESPRVTIEFVAKLTLHKDYCPSCFDKIMDVMGIGSKELINEV